MKRKCFFWIAIAGILSGGCSNTGSTKKPKNLIPEETMEKIIYDATLIDIMSSFSEKNPNFEDIMGKSYLFIKYNVDSLQLANSESYYAKNPKLYYRIHAKVIKRIDKEKDSLNALEKKTKTK
ncbi:MAG: DUF4296 domain-containing protein [Flavobacteriaceae bacterium]